MHVIRTAHKGWIPEEKEDSGQTQSIGKGRDREEEDTTHSKQQGFPRAHEVWAFQSPKSQNLLYIGAQWSEQKNLDIQL